MLRFSSTVARDKSSHVLSPSEFINTNLFRSRKEEKKKIHFRFFYTRIERLRKIA